jgi:hypothetical protein
MTDFRFTSFGSVFKVEAVSDAAKDFAEANFPVDGWQGKPTSFMTDWRPANELADRLESEGWEVAEG